MNPNRDFDKAKNDEENVAWLLEYITGREVALMPEFCPFDYVTIKVQKGVRVLSAIVEYRGRPDISKAQYPTVILNCTKVKKIQEYARGLGIENMVFVVKWRDTEPEWVSLADTRGWKIEHFSRNDPERSGDHKEPVYHIPTGEFRPFKTAPPRQESPSSP